MKKLLVTAIGAAVAFGAFADKISQQRIGDFDSTGPVTTNELNATLGNYWSELPGSSNTYAVSALSGVGMIERPAVTPSVSDKALDVKTTFGKPLSVNIVSGGSTNIPNSGIYFDSLVKFTVCEDTPTETYDGAKIVMWLQEQYDGSENITGTNLMVKAGYMLSPGNVVATNYLCGTAIGGDFADAWHRVTIKAMPDITVNSGLGHIAVPGFAIFIDSDRTVISDDSKWAWADGAYPLTETAAHLTKAALFPSLVQSELEPNKGSLTCASFDGTGSLTDIVFTDNAPIDKAKDYVAPKATVVNDQDEPISGSPFTSLEDAVDAVNGLTSGTYTFALSKGVVLDGTLEFASSANIILDFAGCVLTNESDSAAAISNAGNLIITNSTVAVGGVYCSDTGKALVQGGDGELFIYGGVFDGDVDLEEAVSVEIFGGSYNDDVAIETFLAEGKAISEQGATYPNLYDVIDYVPPTTYTVTFISGEGSTTNEYTDVVKGTEQKVPAPAAVVGKSFSAWDPAIAGATVTVTADATYTALYTNNIYTITFVNEIGADPASTNYTIESGAITLPTATTENMGVQFDGWTNATITTAITEFTPSAENVGDFTLYAAWSSTGSSGYDGGDSGTFTIAPGAVATVEAATGHPMTDTVAGSTMTYAQAYALGLVNESTGAVADLETTIEIKDGKVVVGLSEDANENYVITLKVYEKSSLTAEWPAEPTQTYTLGSATATTGFTPGSAGAGFYKTEVTIRNK